MLIVFGLNTLHFVSTETLSTHKLKENDNLILEEYKKTVQEHLNFHDKFDLEGQGQGHLFQTCPKLSDDQ